ncbi:HET-domain-containing protein [Gyrodon lividus]|nr:HET-domain-containing protein [Gyrodon lividus]
MLGYTSQQRSRSPGPGWGEVCLSWARERLGTQSLLSRIPPISPLGSFVPGPQEAKVNQPPTREQLLDYVDRYIFNNIPTHLLRISDMKLVTRNEVRGAIRPQIEADFDAALMEPWNSGFVTCFLDQWYHTYVKKYLRYAILSHRWGISEPEFYEMSSKRYGEKLMRTGRGLEKLLQFCEKARTDYDCAYVWSDTCCINKESSTDLEEAIRSMYRWYMDADICIVHLANSSSVEDFKVEPWFTRGWTLQELLAPKKMRFYGKDWTPICHAVDEGREDEREQDLNFLRFDKGGESPNFPNDKENELLLATIGKVTGCNRVFQKMIWASKRRTTRVEDVAYSLLGMFNITMPIAYGEGDWAFHRLNHPRHIPALSLRHQHPTGGSTPGWSLALRNLTSSHAATSHSRSRNPV